MKKTTSLLSLFTIVSLTAISQTTSPTQRECTISTGIGFANAATNSAAIGFDNWTQISYQVLDNFSLATEFEFMNYKQPGYYPAIQINPNETNVYDNNFSLLIKYNFPTKSKLKVYVASGWTYCIRATSYYWYTSNGNGQDDYQANTTAFSDYRIPFLAELKYPISKNLNIEARAKYNFNPQNGGTYAAGLGLGLKL